MNKYPVSCVRNLGVLIDEGLTMQNHVQSICQSSYHYLRNIRQIRPYLTINAAKTIIHSIISSRLDYCNSLLYGVPDFVINKLQLLQNCAARVVLNINKFDSITSGLKKLHWLPVKERIQYKIILIVYKALNGNQPIYIQTMLEPYIPARKLRSSDKQFILKEKRAKLVTMGDRAFSISAPRLWNSLPDNIRNPGLELNAFKTNLKTFLFQKTFGRTEFQAQ